MAATKLVKHSSFRRLTYLYVYICTPITQSHTYYNGVITSPLFSSLCTLDYTREDLELDPAPADPTADAVAELGRCAWAERELSRPGDEEVDESRDVGADVCLCICSWSNFPVNTAQPSIILFLILSKLQIWLIRTVGSLELAAN